MAILGCLRACFFYVRLPTKRKNKCKQCQKEKTKGHTENRKNAESVQKRSVYAASRRFSISRLT